MGEATGSHVLLLEDDPELLQWLADTLRRGAHRVTVHPAERSSATERGFDLLVIGRVSSQHESIARSLFDNVPVLALRDVGDGGADAYLSPPFSGAELLEAVELVVQLSGECADAPASLVDVGAVLDLALQRASEALSKRTQVTREFDTQLRVLASAEQLGLVFLNLLLMAAARMDASRSATNGIRIAGWRTAEGRTVVEISDNGQRIATRQLERLFEGRGEGAASGARGLNLPASQRAVSAHGGAITVTSSAAGSRFRVELPTAGITS